MQFVVIQNEMHSTNLDQVRKNNYDLEGTSRALQCEIVIALHLCYFISFLDFLVYICITYDGRQRQVFPLKDETPTVQTSCKANHLYRDGNKYKTLRGQVIKSTFAPMKSNSKWEKHISLLRDYEGWICMEIGVGWGGVEEYFFLQEEGGIYQSYEGPYFHVTDRQGDCNDLSK